MVSKDTVSHVEIANDLMNTFKIAINKHGVFFDMTKNGVLRINDLQKEIVKKYPSIKSNKIKEVIRLIDILSQPCELSSCYFRKGTLSYGVYLQKRK